MTFELKGKTFTVSPTNTVGAKLSDLMEGDKVTVEAPDIETREEPINAIVVEVVGHVDDREPGALE